MDETTQVHLLKIRSAIADKEMVIANMNRETSKDGWLCDWNKAYQDADSTVQFLINQFYKL